MTGSQVAYHLRVNKYVDRKLFTEALRLVNTVRPIQNFGYVSMGGAYLEDCRVIHNEFGISRMYCFDSDERVLVRQRVNKPFGFITCKQCESRQAVQAFDEFRASLGGPETNVVTWLDYTAPGKRKEQLQDIAVLVPSLIEWDVVRVTMNAHRSSLGENTNFMREMDKATAEQKANGEFPGSLAAWRHAQLKHQLGDDLPADRDNAEFLGTEDGFVRTILRTIKRIVVRALASRPELVAVPLLSTGYADVQMMATVSFVVMKVENENKLHDAMRVGEWQRNPGDEWDNYTAIQVPHLSLRERHLVHEAMAQGGEFSTVEPAFATPDELAQYRTHYLRYPTFAPLEII